MIHLEANQCAKRLVNTQDGTVKVLHPGFPADSADRVSKKRGRLRVQKKVVGKIEGELKAIKAEDGLANERESGSRHERKTNGQENCPPCHEPNRFLNGFNVSVNGSLNESISGLSGPINGSMNGPTNSPGSMHTINAQSGSNPSLNSNKSIDQPAENTLNPHLHGPLNGFLHDSLNDNGLTSSDLYPAYEDESDSAQYVFVPVGNGLYRKESRFKIPTGATKTSANTVSAPAQTHPSHHHTSLNGGFHGINGEKPLIIAPMQLDGASIAELGDFMQLGKQAQNGYTQDGLDQDVDPDQFGLIEKLLMDPAAASTTVGDDHNTQEDEFYDIYYAASCVMPGGCECGDGCQCVGCSTHDHRA